MLCTYHNLYSLLICIQFLSQGNNTFAIRTGFEPVVLPLKGKGGQLGTGTFTHLVYSNPLEVTLRLPIPPPDYDYPNNLTMTGHNNAITINK